MLPELKKLVQDVKDDGANRWEAGKLLPGLIRSYGLMQNNAEIIGISSDLEVIGELLNSVYEEE